MRTLAILLFCLPVQLGQAQDKIAPPDAESLQKATALVRELYKEKYEAATTAEQKQALAAELLKKATTLQNDAATRYVILRDAGSYSVKAGDMKLALQVVEEMDRTFQIDAAKMKLAVVNAIQSAWKDNTAWTPLFDGKTLGKWLVVDEGEFRNHGAVQTENEGLYLRKGNPATGIRWAGQFFKTDYELSLEAMKVEGESFFCGLTLPVGDAFCTFIVGGWDGDVIGISNIDGKPANTNSTTQFRAFETKRWYSIRLRITKERLEAYLDEEKVVDLATKGRNLEVWPQQEPTKPLGISTWRTTGAIRNIRMRPLAGQE